MENDDKRYIFKDGLVYKNQFHVIFCPKYKRPVLVNGVDTRLKEILYEEAESLNVTIKEINIMPDYVHMLIEFDPRIMLHKVIKHMKANSSKKLRSEFPELVRKLPCLWTRHYFSCTDGCFNKNDILKYVDSQKGR